MTNKSEHNVIVTIFGRKLSVLKHSYCFKTVRLVRFTSFLVKYYKRDKDKNKANRFCSEVIQWVHGSSSQNYFWQVVGCAMPVLLLVTFAQLAWAFEPLDGP